MVKIKRKCEIFTFKNYPLGGEDFNVGPSDVAHEEHAKLEEAAQKALNIIEHAGKYMDESIKEQSKQSAIEPYNAKDIKKSDWREKSRKKRQATDKYPMPVPQTDSDAAKGTPVNGSISMGSVGSWEPVSF